MKASSSTGSSVGASFFLGASFFGDGFLSFGASFFGEAPFPAPPTTPANLPTPSLIILINKNFYLINIFSFACINY